MTEPKFIGKAKVTCQGQLTLPLEGRKDLQIDAGTELYWYLHKEALILVKELTNQKELLKNIFSKKTGKKT
jgi:bifunctional DNA-binding transcriptional regulator/antitoxin component of YhaV-PrlF toxin-antitoxin module